MTRKKRTNLDILKAFVVDMTLEFANTHLNEKSLCNETDIEELLGYLQSTQNDLKKLSEAKNTEGVVKVLKESFGMDDEGIVEILTNIIDE